jgi:hypothetical protein
MIDVLRKLSQFTKWITGIGLICLLYGIAARVVPVYFFWESIYIGCILITIGIIGQLIALIKPRRKLKKNIVGIIIALGFLSFALSIQLLMVFTIPNSEAYSAAKKELSENSFLRKDIGKITGFSPIPIGQLSTVEDPVDYSGDAFFMIIVKGSKKYVLLSVTMHKNYGEEWKILDMN